MAQLRIGCVVMAAGNARRFGENKLAVQVQGKALFHRRWRPYRRSSSTGRWW